ncbi:hypothetical protein, partial [Staphylococcus aureus]
MTPGDSTLHLELAEPLQLPYSFEVVCESSATLHRCEVKSQNGAKVSALVVETRPFDTRMGVQTNASA